MILSEMDKAYATLEKSEESEKGETERELKKKNQKKELYLIWRRNPRAGTTDGLRKLGPLMADRFRDEQQSRIAILRSVSSRMHRIWMRAGRSKVIGSISGPFHRNFWYPDHEFVCFFLNCND